MTYFDKNKWLGISIITLFVVNLGLLTFLWLKPDEDEIEKPKKAGPPKEVLAKELNFNDGQSKKLQELKVEHHQKVESYQDSLKDVKTRYFKQMKSDSVDVGLLIKLSSQMAEYQSRMDYLTLMHFKSIRQICDSSQQNKFDNIISETVNSALSPPLITNDEKPLPPIAPDSENKKGDE